MALLHSELLLKFSYYSLLHVFSSKELNAFRNGRVTERNLKNELLLYCKICVNEKL